MSTVALKSPDFGMFTKDGNELVHIICIKALLESKDWPAVYRDLQNLAGSEDYAEAMDTEVRECVYRYMKFDTNFYI